MEKNKWVLKPNLLKVLAKVQGHSYNVLASVTQLRFSSRGAQWPHRGRLSEWCFLKDLFAPYHQDLVCLWWLEDTVTMSVCRGLERQQETQ